MLMTRTFAAILAPALAGAGSAAQAEPDKVQYELQERCSKDTVAFVKDFDLRSYTNHYNPDLNGCFVLIDRSGMGWDGNGNLYAVWELWDVNENRQIDEISFDPPNKINPDGTTNQPVFDCMSGNFGGCSDLDSPPNRTGYLKDVARSVKHFAESVQTYMQRSSAN